MNRIDGFEHRTGAHCGSTSLRNLAEYHGWGYDEPTCFGLGSGLGFTYLEFEESPYRGFFGRPVFLEEAFFDHLGIEYRLREGDGWNETLGDVRRAVDRGRPAMVFTDIYGLDYFGTDTHFAPHSLLVVGYGDGEVLLADSEFEDLQRLPTDRLRAAMNSTHVVPLENRRLVPESEASEGFETAASRAIAETAAYHLDPGSVDRDLGPGVHGIDGIESFAEDLPGYAALPDADWTIRFAYQNVERRGTGGGAFRRLYARFLETAADRLDAIPDSAPEVMTDVADGWSDVGAMLRDASELDGGESGELRALLEEASEDVNSLAERERALFGELAAAVPTFP